MVGSFRFLSGTGILKRFRRNKAGATAIEFAMVAMPFFALTFATLESSLSFFVGQVLETATADTARQIMTGEVRSTTMSAGDFHARVCANIPALIPCGDVQIDVRRYNQFSDAQISKPTIGGGGVVNWGGADTNPLFETGAGGDLIVVRVMYPMPVFTNIFGASVNGASLATMNDGAPKMLLMATSSFRNEPFL